MVYVLIKVGKLKLFFFIVLMVFYYGVLVWIYLMGIVDMIVGDELVFKYLSGFDFILWDFL